METNVTIEGFPARRLDVARAAVAKSHAGLVRSAARTGQVAPAAPVINVLREYVKSRCTECHDITVGFTGRLCQTPRCLGYVVACSFVDLEVVAERPTLAGWDFLAVVEPLVGGNLIRQVPGADVADGELVPWRTGEIACDHCETRRRRSETFVVRADGSDPAVPAGTYKQVGRQCLGAFLGGKSAATIIASLGLEALIREAGDGEGGGWSGPGVYDPAEFLAWTASSVRVGGWISKKAAGDRQATADHVKYLLTPPFGGDGRAAWEKARENFKPTDEDRARGAAALEWAKLLSDASDYERNLRLVAQQPALEPSHAGILASAVAAHARVLGEEVRRKAAAASPSKHVGEVKSKVAATVTVERVSSFETQYGELFVHTFRDADGNALVWKTGKSVGAAGDVLALTGTVKAHTEFRGEQQTELTRCKIASVA